MTRLHALGRVVPEAPRARPLAARGVLRRLVRAGAAAADRLHPARRPVADAGLPRRCRRAAPSSRRSRPPSRRARSSQKNPHVKLVYTAIGGGSTGADPFIAARRGRGAQGDADDQHDAARRAQRRQQAGDRAPSCARRSRRCPARASTSASAARREKYVLVLAGEDGDALAEHARAGRARAAHDSRHRQRHVDREPGAARS